MHCKACNKLLEDYELLDHPHVPDTSEDLCITCRNVSYESLQELEEEDNPLQLIDELQAIVDNSN